jgi:hypothetical protein
MVAEPGNQLLVGSGCGEVTDFEEKCEFGVGEPRVRFVDLF